MNARIFFQIILSLRIFQLTILCRLERSTLFFFISHGHEMSYFTKARSKVCKTNKKKRNTAFTFTNLREDKSLITWKEVYEEGSIFPFSSVLSFRFSPSLNFPFFRILSCPCLIIFLILRFSILSKGTFVQMKTSSTLCALKISNFYLVIQIVCLLSNMLL